MVEVSPLPWLTPVWVAAGFGLLWWLVQRVAGGERMLRNVLLTSYVVRVLLAVGLFCISYWRLPILPSFQTWPGFWVFSYDAPLYHRLAVGILDSWAKGIELPYFEVGVEYFALVAVVYKLLGAHPIFPMLLNCVLAALSGLLAYRIGRRLVDNRAGRTAAILVSCWPSSFLWSAQLLKDAPSWFLIFCVLWLVLRLLPRPHAALRSGLGRWGLLATLLAVFVIALARFRFYVVTSYSIAAALVLLPAAAFSLKRRQFSIAAAHVGIVAVVGFSTLFARTLDTRRLFTPSHPERAHYRIAVEALEHQDVREAKNHFSLAIVANPSFTIAYLGLAMLTIQEGHLEEALTFYVKYLKFEEDLEKQASVKPLASQLWFQRGNQHLQDLDYGAAVRAYEASLQLEPREVAVYLNLSVARTYRGEYEHALAALERARPHISSEDQQRQIDEEWKRVAAQQTRYHDVMQRLFEEAKAQPGFESLSDAQVEERLEPLKDGWRPEAQQAVEHLNRPVGSVPVVDREQVVSSAVEAFTTRHDEGLQAPPKSEGKIGELLQHAREIDEVVVQKTYGATPATLNAVRRAFVNEGGSSVIDPTVYLSDPKRIIAYLPRALAIGFLAPFPFEWPGAGGRLGQLRTVAKAEALLMYLLLPGVLVGCWRFWKHRQLDGILIVACVLLTSIPIALVIANVGTLFRVRLLFILPLLVIAAAGQEVYGTLLHRLSRVVRRAPQGATRDAVTAAAKEPVQAELVASRKGTAG